MVNKCTPLGPITSLCFMDGRNYPQLVGWNPLDPSHKRDIPCLHTAITPGAHMLDSAVMLQTLGLHQVLPSSKNTHWGIASHQVLPENVTLASHSIVVASKPTKDQGHFVSRGGWGFCLTAHGRVYVGCGVHVTSRWTLSPPPPPPPPHTTTTTCAINNAGHPAAARPAIMACTCLECSHQRLHGTIGVIV